MIDPGFVARRRLAVKNRLPTQVVRRREEPHDRDIVFYVNRPLGFSDNFEGLCNQPIIKSLGLVVTCPLATMWAVRSNLVMVLGGI